MVVTHQSAEHLPGLLAAVEGQLRRRRRAGDRRQRLQRRQPRRWRARPAGALQVIETGENLGFAGGCHAGAQATRAPLLLFLNPDCQPQPECLERLRRGVRGAPRVGRLAGGACCSTSSASTPAAASSTTSASAGPATASGRSRRCPHARSRDRVPLGSGDGRAPRGVGARSVGSTATTSCMARISTSACACGCQACASGSCLARACLHSYEFDKGAGEVVLAGAQPLAHGAVGLSRGAARCCWRPRCSRPSSACSRSPRATAGWRAKLRAQAATLTGLPRTLARRRAVQRERRIGARELAEQPDRLAGQPLPDGLPRAPG